MSYQEIAKSMIDHLPEDKLIFIINILKNFGEMSRLNLYPDFKPNAETLAAMAQTDEMIRTGNGQHFEGTAEAFTNLPLLYPRAIKFTRSVGARGHIRAIFGKL